MEYNYIFYTLDGIKAYFFQLNLTLWKKIFPMDKFVGIYVHQGFQLLYTAFFEPHFSLFSPLYGN